MSETKISIFGAWILFWVTVLCRETYAGGQCTDPRYREGICRPFRDCPIVQEELARNVTPSLCGVTSGDYQLASTFVIKYTSYPDIEVTNVLIHKNSLAHPIVCCPHQPLATSQVSLNPPSYVLFSPPTPPPEVVWPEIPPETITESGPSIPPRLPTLPPPTPPPDAVWPEIPPETTESGPRYIYPDTFTGVNPWDNILPKLPESYSTQLRVPGGRANYWCSEYTNVCGAGISGGRIVEFDEFPHMAAIGYGEENDIKWGCGGSLISYNFVLTAAHCLHSGVLGPAKWVLLGTLRLPASATLLGNAGQIHPVVRNIRHEEYRAAENYHDIGLLQIGPAVTKDSKPLNVMKLHPVCLGKYNFLKPSYYIATGWGRTDFVGNTSPDLLKVDIGIIEKSTCNKLYEDIISGPEGRLSRGIDSTLFCAGNLTGRESTCEGDSGGPLQIPTSDKCQYDVSGITIFGKFCSYANSPSVFLNVTEYIGWIENHVWPWSRPW